MIAWLDSVAHAPPSAALPVLLIQLLHLDISYSFLHLDIAYTTGETYFSVSSLFLSQCYIIWYIW